MGAHIDITTCAVCGEEYEYSFDTRTQEATPITACKCVRWVSFMEKYLEENNLLTLLKQQFDKQEENRKGG